MPWFERLADRPVREAVTVWACVIAALAVSKVTIGFLPFGSSIVGALAVGLFLWAPGEASRRLKREELDYGLNLREWPRDVLFALAVMAIVFPAFAGGFRGFLWARDQGWIPEDWARHLVPYGVSRGFAWRAPKDLLDKVAGNLAVAIGEEYFYRGYMMERFTQCWPPVSRVLGAPFGKAAVLQTALFAAGHLLTPQGFRLGTFFPGLLFTWMAARSGRVVPGAIVHWGSNLLINTLEASAFGV